MKIKNPNRTVTDATQRAAVSAVVNALGPTDKDLTFDDIRARVPELADAEDGTIHQICIDAGYEVEV